MKCAFCKKEFPESELELSHDIPKYMGGTDLDGRHYLCKKHHEDYDNLILMKCSAICGKGFVKEERIGLMVYLSKQTEQHKEFREIAKKIWEEFYNQKWKSQTDLNKKE